MLGTKYKNIMKKNIIQLINYLRKGNKGIKKPFDYVIVGSQSESAFKKIAMEMEMVN